MSRRAAPPDFDPHEIEQRFREVVNLAAAELDAWLATSESRAVGEKDASGESIGRRSGRRVVEILSRGDAALTDADPEHMRRVVGFVRRHLAQRPQCDVRDTRRRFALLNWGHDSPRGPGDA